MISAILANTVSFFAILVYFAYMETISPVYARLVLREVLRRGMDPAPLFADIALDSDGLQHGGDIGMQDFLHIVRAGNTLLGNEPMGFVLGQQLHVLAMGPVGAAIASAPTLRAGLQVLESFTRLHASYVDIGAHSTLRGMTIKVLYRHDTGDVESFHTQTAMVLLQQYIEIVAGEPITDLQFRLAVPGTENKTTYTAALHGNVTFDADANEIDVPHHWLDAPSPFYHPELWRQAQLTLSRDLKNQLEAENASFTQHIAGLLRTSEPPLPDLGDVAFDLNISQRTLNRRLQAEGTSFRQLKSDALARWAKQYLRETTHSVEAIAEELGYTDTSNFRRAFRKSVGCSPIEYRNAHT